MKLATELRPARSGDAQALAVLGRRTFQETFGGLYPDEDMEAFLTSAYEPALQARELDDPQWRTWVVAQGGELLGYAQLVMNCPLPGGDAGTSAELHRIYVVREALGSGLGRRLLDQVLACAREAGVRRLWLGVWEHNDRAQAFYRGYGFTRVGEHGFQVGTRTDTDHLLAVELP